ncbi:MAG: 4'-phosphopantetheinyl transferase family protein [Solirubrobacteraceae bacterium]
MDAPRRTWSPGPARARAQTGAVDVWRADLTAIEPGLEDLLRADERARAAGILNARNRTLWARSRGLLRALLGRYLEGDPRELRFVLGPHGKPAPAPGGGLRFNLSHSGGLALVAVSTGREVGVDLEHARERYTPEFLRAWVAREAAVKCRGTGLAISQAPSLEADPWTTELDVGPGSYAAVAVEHGPCELHSWDWPVQRREAPPVSVASAASARKAAPGPPGALPPSPPQI